MNTVQITKEQLPTTELSQLSVLDRLALNWGLAMISWAERPQRTRSSLAPDTFDAIQDRRELLEARHRVAALQ